MNVLCLKLKAVSQGHQVLTTCSHLVAKVCYKSLLLYLMCIIMLNNTTYWTCFCFCILTNRQ